MDPRACAAPMGSDPERSWRCAIQSRVARERYGEVRRGGYRLSRGTEGADPGTSAASLGSDPEQSGQCTFESRGERERNGKARRGESCQPAAPEGTAPREST